jgi:hypothetical protein
MNPSRAFVLGPFALVLGAQGDCIFNTGPQAAGGLEICSAQSAAIRFTPTHDCSLTSVSVWTMSNVPAGEEAAPVITVTVRADVESVPGGQVLESWTRPISAIGQSAVLEPFASQSRPLLLAGQSYWIVAQSGAPAGRDPVWNFSTSWTGLIGRNAGGGWVVETGAALAAQVNADATCDTDFNHDGDAATDADIESFFACVVGDCCETCGSADFNADGDAATDADIESFFRVLAGGAC